MDARGARGAADRWNDAPRVILGLSAGFHDAAAALIVDGKLVAAVEEERLSRRKHDASFPQQAADCCLAIAELEVGDVDAIAFHEKPLTVASRHLAARVSAGPRSIPSLLSRTPGFVGKQLRTPAQIGRYFRHRDAPTPPVVYVEHHTSHAAAAFYPSPFEDAAVLTVDGVGEWASATSGHGEGRRLHIEHELRYPDSVGLLYSAFTSYCGFAVNGGEGELMGLAPFGTPVHADTIRRELLDQRPDGAFHVRARHLPITGRRATSRRFHDLFGGPPRPLGAEPTQREADLAASVQVVVEDILLSMASWVHRRTDASALCLAGGVALNCVANGRLAAEGPFDDVWVQPAAGDAGNAIGAALWTWHEVLEHPRSVAGTDAMEGCFLGPSFSDEEIVGWLDDEGIDYHRPANRQDLCQEVASLLDGGKIVGWFDGRMEFGPRALGHRSILADARDPTAQGRINHLVKERAAFRPFAPAVLASDANQWFDIDRPLPYMTFTAAVSSGRRVQAAANANDERSLTSRVQEVRSEIPAVTHVDGSARVQTVDPEMNPEFGGLLATFASLTGCPVLLNTSFNARDEPIVCTPDDAYRTFRQTGLDALALGPVIINR